MMVFYSHLTFFVFFFTAFLLSLLVSLLVSSSSQTLFLSFNLFSFWNLEMSFSVYLDFYSTWFSSVVLLISSVVMVYSYTYLNPYSNPMNFLWMTSFFVISMMVVVFFSDLFFIMLGWDGLGLISFFLILYYQNPSSVSSGCFTLMMNRLGDCFFLTTMAFLFSSSPTFFLFSSLSLTELTTLLLTISFMTKSALYPFSSWLPEAMAAPTPISSLVHSSTLVTAGLYLMIRYSFFLYSSYPCMLFLMFSSLFTSFYAGVNTIFERDLKKLIALSTLSHLGFMGLSYSVGLPHLCFFHMLTHALFKSLLFMSMGDIMMNLSHSQDIRFLSSGKILTPFSCSLMYVSLMNLLGLPFMSGFFSKDLVLEMVMFSDFSFMAYFFMTLNLILTYYYTYQLFYFSFSSLKTTAFLLSCKPPFLHIFMLSLLSLLSITMGVYFQMNIYLLILSVPLPILFKNMPMLINFLIFFCLLVFLKQPTPKGKSLTSLSSSMFFLSLMSSPISGSLFKSLLFKTSKSLELGGLSSILSLTPKSLSETSSILLLTFTSLSFKHQTLTLFIMLMLFYLFI